MASRMHAGVRREQEHSRARYARGAFVTAFAIATVLLAGRASAYDWTDADCSHWQGPKHAECVQAHARLATANCGRWTPGEKEFVKCQQAHNWVRLQECKNRGEALRRSAQERGWDGVATVQCPLVNEQTGAIEGQ